MPTLEAEDATCGGRRRLSWSASLPLGGLALFIDASEYPSTLLDVYKLLNAPKIFFSSTSRALKTSLLVELLNASKIFSIRLALRQKTLPIAFASVCALIGIASRKAVQ